MENDFTDRLFEFARKVPEPANLFSGKKLTPGFELPDNILIFFHDYAEPLPNAHGRHTLVIPFSCMTYFVERKKLDLMPGILLYVPPFATRFMHQASSGYSRLFITFSAPDGQNYLPSPGVSRFSPETETLLQEFLRQYTRGTPEETAVSLMRFLLRQKQITPEKTAESTLPGAVAQVIELVEGNLAGSSGIKDLADKVKISASHLRLLFRRHTGISLGQFIAEKKMAYAKYRLSCTDMPLKDVASGCGFANIFVFSAFFKRNAGIPPSIFRKKQQQSGENE